jgi:rhodanese-related sulfurtransferase
LTSTAELLQALPDTAAWVDARNWEAFLAGRVAGAMSLPAAEKIQHLARLFDMLPQAGGIIVYGQEAPSSGSEEMAEFLQQNGIDPGRISIFSPGWKGLEKIAAIAKASGEQP